MVEARSYVREDTGNRGLHGSQFVLRVIEARSYTRENTGNSDCAVPNSFCEW